VCLGLELLGEPADDDHGDARRLGVVLDRVGHVEAVGVVVHHDVEYHEVGALAPQLVARLDAAVRGGHGVAACLQERLRGPHEIAIVVHQQDVLAFHVAPP
jgi:hypothetical protein